MIKDIFLKEIRSHIGSNKMIVTFVIIVVLFATNSIVFIKDYKDSFINYREIVNDNHELIHQNAANLWHLTFIDQKLTYPPSALGFISEAWEKKLPNGLEISTFFISNPKYFQKNEEIFFSESKALDWNNIFILFVSFICIFFSYNAFSGEKEKGTLKLMLSNSVSKTHILFGKYLGMCFVTFIPVVAGALISIIIFLLSPAIQLQWNYLFNILFYFTAAGLFISLNILLGMLISSLTYRPIVSLNIIIMIWLFFAIVIPGIAWIAAKKLKPVESVERVNDKIGSEMRALGGSMWNDFWEEPNQDVLNTKYSFDKRRDIINNIWNDYRNSLFEQTQSGIVFSKISPFEVFRFLGDKLADNGFFRYNNFFNQANHYKQSFSDFIIYKDKTDQDSHNLIWSMKYQTRKFMSNKPVPFEEVPKFEYKPASFYSILDSTKGEVLILILWNLILIIFTFYFFLKYDPR